MRWHLFAVGSRGDVQPLLALACALREEGHEVLLATLDPHRELVCARGVEHASLGPLPARYRDTGPLDLRFTGLSGRLLFWASYRQVLSAYLSRFAELAVGAEGLIFSGLAFPLYHLAEEHRIPAVSASLVPHFRNRQFPDPFFAGHPLAGLPGFNQLSAELEQTLMLELNAGLINRWRVEDLGLPPIGRGRWRAHRAGVLQRKLLACSERLLPPCRERPARLEVTGFWELAEDPAWTPEEEVSAFMEEGSPPILVSFGSMTAGVAARRFRVTLSAAAELDQRVLVLGDRSPEEVRAFARVAGLPAGHLLARPSLPHGWLLPQVKLAVHHGGIGTLAATARAGKPSVVIPYGYDQRFWAEQVERLGIGRGWLGRGDPDRAWLLQALAQAQATQTQTRTRELGQALAREEGARAAARIISTIRRSTVA